MATNLEIAVRAVNEASTALQAVHRDLGDIGRAADDASGGLGRSEDSMRTMRSSADEASRATSGLRSNLLDVGKVAGGFILAEGIMQAPTIIKGWSDAASDLNETLSKSNTIFGENAGEVEKWASSTATSIGQSKQQALESAASFGNMFQQLGIGNDQATDMSITMTELASDFASFHNADITQVLEAQSAAFRGEYDSMQRFIPTINAATVEQKALEMSGKSSTSALTEQDKALAVHSLMLENAGAAVGDFSRTSDEAANQNRILSAQWDDMQARIGNYLLPIMTTLTSVMLDYVLPGFEKLIPIIEQGSDGIGFLVQHGEELAPILIGVAVALSATLVPAVYASITAIYAQATAWAAAAAATIAANAPLILIAASIGAVIAIIVLLIQHWDDLKRKFPILEEFETRAKAAFGGVVDFVRKDLIPMLQRIGEVVSEVFDRIIRPMLEGWLSWFIIQLETVIGVLSGLIDFLVGVFTGDWDRAWQGIKEIATSLIDGAMATIETIFDTGLAVVKGLLEVFDVDAGAIWTAIKNNTVGRVTEAKDGIVGLWTDAKDLVVGIWTETRDWVTDRAQGLRDNVVDRVTDAKNTAVGIFTDGRDLVTGIWDETRDWVSDRAGAMKDNVVGFAGDIKDGVIGRFEDVRDTVGGIWDKIKSNLATPANAVIRGINGFLGGMVSGVNKVAGFLGLGSPLGAWSDIPQFAQGVTGFSGGLAIVGEEGPELVRLPAGADVVPSPATEALARALDRGVAIGGWGDLVPGGLGNVPGALWDGMKEVGGELAGGIREALSWGAEKLVNTALSAVGVSTPSLPGGMAEWGAAFFGMLKDGLVEIARSWIKGVEENLPLATGQWMAPLRQYSISQRFGRTDFSDVYATGAHSGVDMAAPLGTPIWAADGGTVAYAGWLGNYGNAVIINHAAGLQSLYGHMQYIIARFGELVGKGEQIGTVDSTGFSTGHHLHFEARQGGVPVDPMQFVSLEGGGITQGPRRAIVGDNLTGEEAIIPLDRHGIGILSQALQQAGAQRGDVHISVTVDARGADAGAAERIVRTVEREFPRLFQRQIDRALGPDAMAAGIPGGVN